MKLKLLFIAITFFSAVVLQAQVGVGNTDPQATLDITASSTSSPANNDGILIPRMSNFPSTPGATRDGMLIFYTGASASGKGFYYWDSGTSLWVAVAGPPATNDIDWYEQGTANAPNNINDNMYTNGFVGISNPNPDVELDVRGKAEIIGFGGSNTGNTLTVNRLSQLGGAAIFAENSSSYNLQSYAAIETANILTDLTTEINKYQTGTLLESGVLVTNNALNGYTRGVVVDFAQPGTSNWVTDSQAFLANIDYNGGGAGTVYGFNANISGTGGARKYGTYIDISESSGGTHYGLYSDTRKSNSYAAYFIGRTSLGTGTTNRYLMPAIDGNANQVMSTNGFGTVSFVDASTLFTDTNTTYNGTDFALSNQSLPAGQFVTGISAAGTLIGATPPDSDNQNIQGSGLSGTNLTIGIQNGSSQVVDLSSLQDGVGTDDQNLTSASLSGTTLNLGIENGSGVSVDLSSLQDGIGTDNQTLFVSGSTLGISGGNSININSINTDNQTIDNFSFNTSTNILSLEIENDGLPVQSVNLSSLSTSDADWYEEGTSTTPNNINDNIFTQGRVGIGDTTPDAALNVENTNNNDIHAAIIDFSTTTNSITSNPQLDGLPSALKVFAEGRLLNRQMAAGIFSLSGPMNLTQSNSVGIIVNNTIESVSDNSGIISSVTGTSQTNYGISALATGGTTNWAGYFGGGGSGSGNVYIQDNLEIDGSLNYTDGNEAAGFILGSNATGDANWVDPSTLITGNTLDQAYDEGGAGAGRTITADNGALEITGTNPNSSGLIVTNSSGSGAAITAATFTASGLFQTVEPTAVKATATGTNGEVIALDASIGNSTNPLPLGNILNYGVRSVVTDSNLSNASTTNYGVYSSANGGDINYAGYFLGNVSIGTTSANNYILPASRGSNGQVMTTDGSGNAFWANATGSSNTASNGLTLTGSDIQLGGTLNQFTTINHDNNSLRFDLTGTGDFVVLDNGTIEFIVEDSGDVGIGTNNPNYLLDVNESDNSEVIAVNIQKTDNSSTFNTAALKVTKTASGSGSSNVIATEDNGTGNGEHRGVFNVLNGTGTGNKFGIKNELTSASIGLQYGMQSNFSGATPSPIYAISNNFTAGTGGQTGVYNNFNNSTSNSDTAMLSLFYSTNNTPKTGVGNVFALNADGDHVGFSNTFAGNSDTEKIGLYSNFNSVARGTMYGAKVDMNSTGNGTKYGIYVDFNSAVTGTNNYGVYASVNQSIGWAGYFLGRLSIGTTTANNYILPASRGTNGQVMTTDGAGNVSFTDAVPNEIDWYEANTTNKPDNINDSIWTSGNVGIGTTTPNYDLSVSGTLNLREDITAAGTALRVNGTEALWYNGTYFSWGFGAVHNYFADAVGIGINAPAYKLDVRDANNGDYVAQIYNTSTNANADGLKIRVGNLAVPTGSTSYVAFFDGNNTVRGRIQGNGTGVTYNTLSDGRLKTNISNINNALNLIDNIQPRRYEYKTKLGAQEFGFIAQELQPLYPQAVTGTPDSDVTTNPMMVDYSRLTPLLTAGIKELKDQVDTLKTENAILKAKLDKLESIEARITALENTSKNSN